MVTFTPDGKIAQIRQSWDQGSLLKQLDVIGRTGRNWPIRDSKDQITLITQCAKSTGGATPAASSSSARNADQVVIRARGNSNNAIRDPHASLALFAPREDVDKLASPVVSPYAGSRPRQRDLGEILGDEPEGGESPGRDRTVISPYAGSNRPRQRDFVEILGDEPVDDDDGASPSRGRSGGPNKPVAPKIGAGKNFQPSRLFGADEEITETEEPERTASKDGMLKPDPRKFEHFDFADGSDPQDRPQPADKKPKATRHDSQWSFDDFTTPQKATASRKLHCNQDVRHWGNENDVVQDTPVKKPQQVKPRRDAETHFEFQDDGVPMAGGEPRPGRQRGESHNTGLHLYDNNLYNEDGSAPTAPGPVLGNITNLKDRRKDFDAHFTMTDEPCRNGNNGSGAAPGTEGGGGGGSSSSNAGKISDDRQKAVKMMESNWDASDDSPTAQKENSKPVGGGGKKTGDDRGISIAGDGMGGKKGSGRGWAIGDESDEEPAVRAKPGKTLGAAQKTSNFWDF